MVKQVVMKASNYGLAAKRHAIANALLFASLCALTPYATLAQDMQGRNWAGACTGCHGSEGRSSGVIPSIAGMEKAKFVRLMAAFQDGSQPATLMNQIARGLSAEQIDKLADYFASRKPGGGQSK